MLKGGITDMPHYGLGVLPYPTAEQQQEMLRVQSLNAKQMGKEDVFANTVFWHQSVTHSFHLLAPLPNVFHGLDLLLLL